MSKQRTTAALGAVVLAMSLSACGSGGEPEAAPATHTAANGDVYNDVDVDFATGMIPHHAEAVQMVVLADKRPLDPEVEQIANAIRDTQVMEVEQMITWLTDWNQKIPETSLDHANAGHGTDHMDGSEGVEELQEASDAEFQDLWLELMIEHHESAIEMARTEQADGTHPDTVALAKTIREAQAEEIETLEGLLDS